MEPFPSDTFSAEEFGDAQIAYALQMGTVAPFFILTVAAAESGIGLAILVVLFRNMSSIDVDDLDSLKG